MSWDCKRQPNSENRVQCLVFSRGKSASKAVEFQCWGGGYSRLLSPFHLQVPLCLPEPSPGTLAPPCTSGSSSSSSSRDIHLDAMLPSNSRTGAPARCQGSEGSIVTGWVITHAAVPGNAKQQNFLLLGFPRSVSPGPRLLEPRGGDHTFSADSPPPPGGGLELSGGQWCVSLEFHQRQTRKVQQDFWTLTLKYWSCFVFPPSRSAAPLRVRDAAENLQRRATAPTWRHSEDDSHGFLFCF